ncbi:MAG: hypothetical protein FJW20_17180 [Acidimicrobiia bacterium]|nr:hypothetical protein [Acidimicrobiia bacterium]
MKRPKEINLSEARRTFSHLLREIEEDPATGYRITVRGKCIAELKAPAARQSNLAPGKAMLAAARKMEQMMPQGASLGSVRNYREQLYGEGGLIDPSAKPKSIR